MTDPLTSRERVRLALDHQEPDRVPIALGFSVQPPVAEALRDYWRLDSVQSVHRRLADYADLRGAGPRYVGPPLGTAPDGSQLDMWGVGRTPKSYGSGEYHEITHYPLAHVTDVSQLDQHPWPQVEWFDFSGVADQIAATRRERDCAIRIGNGNVLECSWYMRGLEQVMVDLLINPELITAIMARVTDYFEAYLRAMLESAPGQIDLVMTADDIGTQKGLMMRLETWEELIKPHHVRLNRVIHEHGVKVLYHTDGSVMEAVPGLMDMGIDVLEALQFDATGMCPRTLKDLYGDRLCFHGGVSVQKTLPFGTVDDVRREVIERIDVLGAGGGYILAPSHAVQAGTPPENVEAMFETARHYRRA